MRAMMSDGQFEFVEVLLKNPATLGITLKLQKIHAAFQKNEKKYMEYDFCAFYCQNINFTFLLITIKRHLSIVFNKRPKN